MAEAPPSVAVVLKHPSGSQVYIVGSAHVSRKAAEDAVAVIQRVSPAVVVLELDEERFRKLHEAAASGSPFGLDPGRIKGSFKIAVMALTGEILPYASGLFYICTGAVMGTRPGGEFLAASEAAEEAGSQVVLADRDQNVTLRRLMYFSQHMRQAGRDVQSRRLERMLEDQGRRQAEGGGAMPDFLSREPTWRSKEEREAVLSPEDPWGLGADDTTKHGMKRRLLEMMREGGCQAPNQVLEAAKRIFAAGMSDTGSIAPTDVLTVRDCGTRLVESFRQRALAGDATWMQRLEQEQAAGAKGAAGMECSNAAMQKVIVQERDIILARKLWEAGETAAGQPVVGVVGAGHVKGIEKWWPEAGSPALEQRVQEYMSDPQREEGSPRLTAVATAGVLGLIAYRRPKAAAFFVGAVSLMTAPYVGFAVASMNRFGQLAKKLTSTAELIEEGGADLESGGGWANGGGGFK